jgi:hypothetical protein
MKTSVTIIALTKRFNMTWCQRRICFCFYVQLTYIKFDGTQPIKFKVGKDGNGRSQNSVRNISLIVMNTTTFCKVVMLHLTNLTMLVSIKHRNDFRKYMVPALLKLYSLFPSSLEIYNEINGRMLMSINSSEKPSINP